MKHFFYFSCLLLLLGCPENSNTPELELSVSLDYENLITGEVGTIRDLTMSSTFMYSSVGPPFMEPPASFRQTMNIAFSTDSLEYPFFQLNFYPTLTAERVKPITGQTFGQLYTYEEAEDYVSENFGLGDQLNTPLDFSIRFGLDYPTSSRISKADMLNQEDALFELQESQIYYDKHDIPHLFLKGTISCTLINDSFSPFSLQPHFHITEARFSLAVPVDSAN